MKTPTDEQVCKALGWGTYKIVALKDVYPEVTTDPALAVQAMEQYGDCSATWLGGVRTWKVMIYRGCEVLGYDPSFPMAVCKAIVAAEGGKL